MMTPQEVSEHAFAKASFGGYNMAMVDEFLDLLTVDYTTLYKENAVLKSKMKVLVDKVEEYRSTEDAMRKALLTAQKMADEIVAEAEAKKDEVIRLAENEARARVNELRQDVENEMMRLNAAKQATTDYVERLKGLYQHEMEYLSGLSSLTAPPQQQPDPVMRAARDIEASVEKIVAAEAIPDPEPEPEDPSDTKDLSMSRVAATQKEGGLYAELMELNLRGKTEPAAAPVYPRREPEPSPPLEEGELDDSPTRRIDFNNLQFGKEYEIK